MKKFKNTAALWAVMALLLGAGYLATTASAAHAIQAAIQTVTNSQPRSLQTAQQAPVHIWSKVGTCPYSNVPVTAKNVHSFLASPAGRQAAARQGIPANVYKVMVKEADKPNSHRQTMKANTYFDTMIFCGGGMEANVVYTGANISVFVFSVAYKNHVYQITIPWCGNIAAKIVVRKVKAPKPVPTKLVIVQVYAKADSSSGSTSTSSSPGCSASASAGASAGAWASAYAVGTSWAGMSKKTAAHAKAKANAYSKTSTKTTCTSSTATVTQPGTTTTLPGTTTTVPVTTTTPPTTTTVPVPSPTIRVQQIQELYPNETRPLCANVKNVPSGGGTVDFTVQDGAAPKGTVSPASKSVSSGDSQVCVTYQAPATTGTNQYFATLKVGGKQVDQDSLWVEIIAPPSNP